MVVVWKLSYAVRMGVSYGTKMPNNPMSQLACGACYVYRVIPTPRCQGPLVQDLSVDGVLIMISSAFECGTYFYFWKLWSVSYTVPFESIRQSRVTDPCVGTKFESCHGSWGRFVELIFHVTNHSNCLEIVEKWVEATKQIPHLVSPNYS